MDNVYILLELARWDRSGRLLQTLTCASKPLSAFLKINKNVLAALRDSWLTAVTTAFAVRYYDWCWRLHRLDGPASIDNSCGSIWFARGVPHRADGFAHSDTSALIHQGRILYTTLARPTRPALQVGNTWHRQMIHILNRQRIEYSRPMFAARKFAEQSIYLRAYTIQLHEELLWSRRPDNAFQLRWSRWLKHSAELYMAICTAREAYYNIRNELLATGFWYSSDICHKMQAAVAMEFGVEDERVAMTKSLKVRQPKPRQRSRTPAYLGGVTGRMRQR